MGRRPLRPGPSGARATAPRLPGAAALPLALALWLAASAGLAAQEAQEADGDAVAGGRGTLAGAVRAAEDGEPLSDATVVVRELGIGTRTNDNGRFVFRRFDTGRYTVEVRYLGRRSSTVEAVVRPGRITHLELALETEAVEVPGLEVTVRRDLRGKMAGFWERKRRGIGNFVTREEIEGTAGDRFHQVFRGMAGIRVIRCEKGTSVACRRIMSTRQTADFGNCIHPKFYLDGTIIPLDDYPMGVNAVRPAEVEAVEVYAGPSQIPARFSGASQASCGVVVIWTREPGLASDEGG